MEREINLRRIHSIRQMLLEMASGNFSQRIARTNLDDELESLIVLINMVAEEMEETLFPKGYINSHHLQQHPTSISFVVDESFIIQHCTSEACHVLGYTTDFLIGKSFAFLLSTTSTDNFESLQKLISSNETVSSGCLHYINSSGQEVASLFSSISRLSATNYFIIHSIILYSSEEDSTTNGRLPKTRRSDAKLMQHVYDYILANLESPLPPLTELSKIFGTNEHKLKEAFKYFFSTSIYQFYNDERLKRIQILIKQTNIPLKQIAYMNGFNTYPNFSKAFKKKYGYSPNYLKRDKSPM